MSLFLGKIHHWLFNKIQWYEAAENEIIKLAERQGVDVWPLVDRIYREYGQPLNGTPLEEVIDTSNIHGWLQQKIEGAELRQAALVTELLNRQPEAKAGIIAIYIVQGRKAAKEYQGEAESPEAIFKALNDFILEGMPCDRVSAAVEITNQTYSWETTTCLHQPYWSQVGGDVRNFYDFRSAWIKAFVETVNDRFTYDKTEDGLNRIRLRK
jgi:hypothetical protein